MRIPFGWPIACRLVLLAALIALPGFCATAQSPVTSDAPDELDLIHPGDLFEIDVLGSIEFDWRGRLSPEGFVVGYEGSAESIFARCRSAEYLARTFEKALSTVLREPKVNVRILDTSARPVAVVYGAVRVPQRFQIKRPVNLNELIVLSGGFTDQLSGTIQVFRPKDSGCAAPFVPGVGNESGFADISLSGLLKGDPAANVRIFPGDVVTIGEAGPVFVVGGVNNPRPLSFREGLTLTRAIASAGGLAKDARSNDVSIFRRGSGAPVTVDLEAVRQRKADDPVLQKFDIVDVGRRGRERRLAPLSETLSENGSDLSRLPLRVID